MNPESVIIKHINRSDVMLLIDACRIAGAWYEAGRSQSHDEWVVSESNNEFVVKLHRVLLRNQVKSMKLSRKEYRLLMANWQLLNNDERHLMVEIINQIDPLIR